MVEKRFDTKIYNPAIVCDETLKALKEFSDNCRSCNQDGRLTPSQVKYMREWVKFDKSGHMMQRRLINMIIGR